MQGLTFDKGQWGKGDELDAADIEGNWETSFCSLAFPASLLFFGLLLTYFCLWLHSPVPTPFSSQPSSAIFSDLGFRVSDPNSPVWVLKTFASSVLQSNLGIPGPRLNSTLNSTILTKQVPKSLSLVCVSMVTSETDTQSWHSGADLLCALALPGYPCRTFHLEVCLLP